MLQLSSHVTVTANPTDVEDSEGIATTTASRNVWRCQMFSFLCNERSLLQGVETAGLQFRLVDAKEQVVGRLAAQLSLILQVISCSISFDCRC